MLSGRVRQSPKLALARCDDYDELPTNVLVVIGRGSRGRRALHTALAVAAPRATLTLLGVTVPLHWGFAFATTPPELLEELQRECAARLQAASELVPPRMRVETKARMSGMYDALRTEVRSGSYDLVVVGANSRLRLAKVAAEAWRRFVLGSRIPILAASR